MAAPVKNFTGPTGVQAVLFDAPTPRLNRVEIDAAYAQTAIVREPEFNLVAPVFVGQSVQAAAPMVPTPPMGRLVLNTFPSIYKTRGALPFGQIHPPPVPKE